MKKDFRNRPVGVFDSGVGGLTVVKQIREVLPNESIVYIGDTARVPYGTRSKETICRFASEMVEELLTRRVKAVVVACNTVSATCLDEILNQVQNDDIPALGVIEPTVKYAVTQTKTKKVGVIGTEATIKSGAYDQIFKQLDTEVVVLSRATRLLVPIVEGGYSRHEVVEVMLREYLGDWREDEDLDVLILGCTHYPLIKKQISEYMGEKVKIVDSARATAFELKRLLEREKLLSDEPAEASAFFTSDEPEESMAIAREFLGEEISLRKLGN